MCYNPTKTAMQGTYFSLQNFIREVVSLTVLGEAKAMLNGIEMHCFAYAEAFNDRNPEPCVFISFLRLYPFTLHRAFSDRWDPLLCVGNSALLGRHNHKPCSIPRFRLGSDYIFLLSSRFGFPESEN